MSTAAPALTLAERFTGGAHTISTPWGAVHFDDDIWYLHDQANADPSVAPARATLDFGGLPSWLAPDLKRWTAEAWLEENLNHETLRSRLTGVKAMARALASFGGPVTALSGAHARRVGDALALEDLAPETRGRYFGHIRNFGEWLSVRHGVHFRPSLPKASRRSQGPLEADVDRVIPADVRHALLAACRADEGDYELALERNAAGEPLGFGRLTLQELCGRAIKAQAVKVFLCTGRRAKSVTLLPVEPRIEPSADADSPGVWLTYYEKKIHDAPRKVFVPAEYADLLYDAVDRARRYSSSLRAAVPRISAYLFVIPGSRSRGDAAVLLKRDLVNQYLSYPRPPGPGRRASDSGLLARRGVVLPEGVKKILTHDFRVTRETTIRGAGGSIFTAQQDANHVSVDMTLGYYVAPTPEVRAVYDAELNAGAVRLSALATPDASGPRVVDDDPAPAAVSRARRQLLVLQPTAFGFCSYEAKTGPCPTPHPCYLGLEPDAPQVAEGCGCQHQVIAPHALAALRKERRLLLALCEQWGGDPAYAQLASKYRRDLDVVDRQIERASALLATMPGLDLTLFEDDDDV